MNFLQKQLVFNDGRTMAEKHNRGESLPVPKGMRLYAVSVAPAQQRVSIEQFESDMGCTSNKQLDK
jgi:hypothetical protein